jgi:HSP20 family protein
MCVNLTGDVYDRWKETDHGFLLTCATPGLKKEDLNVEVVDSPKGRGHFLVISGESKHEEKHDDKQHGHTLYATYRKFEERVRLPEGVDKNTLSAKYEDGMLQVHVKFQEEEKLDRKRISIS